MRQDPEVSESYMKRFEIERSLIAKGHRGADFMRYYIADLHFFHESLNTMMDHRGFENVEAMNQYMIDKWKSGGDK